MTVKALALAVLGLWIGGMPGGYCIRRFWIQQDNKAWTKGDRLDGFLFAFIWPIPVAAFVSLGALLMVGLLIFEGIPELAHKLYRDWGWAVRFDEWLKSPAALPDQHGSEMAGRTNSPKESSYEK